MNATDLTTFFGQTKFATAANEHGLQIAHTMVLAQWQKDRSGKLDKQVVWPECGEDRGHGLSNPARTAGDGGKMRMNV